MNKGELIERIRENRDITDFQKKVFLAVLDIPLGEVRSYSWVAGKAGTPKGARAVGHALSLNPYAPEVPCHRVISSDGSIGGYSAPGGIEAKRSMLRREGVDI